MKALLALPWFSGAFNEEAMARALEDPYALEPTEHCILRGVRRLRSGHMLLTDGLEEPRQHRWWCTLDGVTPNGDSFERQVARFKELLTDAVKLRMRSDVPLACALSGGLDSSSVLGSMVAAGGRAERAERLPTTWRRAFVATYPGTTADERAFAELVVSHTGVTSSFLSMGPESVANVFDKLVFQCEEVQSPHVGPWFLYEAMRAEGIRVSLDGHGGDELLAGYIHHVRFALERALERWSGLGRAVELLAILEGMGSTAGRWSFPLAHWPRVLARYVRRKGMGRFGAN
jgi:asparagine synthase (glutamine-hydrolysing)